MADENKNVERIVGSSKTDLTNQLKPKMLGLSNNNTEGSKLGFKKTDGNMEWFPAEGTVANYKNVKLSDLAGTGTRNVGVDTDGNLIVSSSLNASGELIKVTENSNTGYILKDDNRAFKGDIGSNAIDLSFSNDDTTLGGALGEKSFSSGFDTIASGAMAHAEGISTQATMTAAHAEGEGTQATNEASHSEGLGTISSGPGSHAEGEGTEATMEGAHAEGISTKATDVSAHAEGNTTQANGSFSHAEGYSTKATSDGAHSEGNTTQANGAWSHTEGENTISTGVGSHAEGYATKSDGDYSHSEGYSTTSTGDYSHVEGYASESVNTYSHAEGHNTKAKGEASHSEGISTVASCDGGHASGKYNVEDTNSIFQVGVGSSDSNRLDALSISCDGKTIKTPQVETTDITDDKQLITKEYFDDNAGSDIPGNVNEVVISNGDGTAKGTSHLIVRDDQDGGIEWRSPTQHTFKAYDGIDISTLNEGDGTKNNFNIWTAGQTGTSTPWVNIKPDNTNDGGSIDIETGSADAAIKLDSNNGYPKETLPYREITDIENGDVKQITTKEYVDTKVEWKGNWINQEYQKNDMVKDGEWTMIANTTTTDRAAPQPIGDPFNPYDGTLTETDVTAKQVIFGNRYTASKDLYITKYRVYTKAGQKYRVYRVLDPLGSKVMDEVTLFEAKADGWEEFSVPQKIITNGTVYDFLVVTNEADPTITTNTANYNYNTPAQAGTPTNGEIRHANLATDILSISKTDNDGTDQSAMLSALSIGDKIKGPGIEWTIQGITDQGSYIDFAVDPQTQGNNDGVFAFEFVSVTTAPISYSHDDGYWTGNANADGLLAIDSEYENITPDDNAYGIDITIQEVYKSPDWDIVAVSSTSSSGGSGESLWIEDSPDGTLTPITDHNHTVIGTGPSNPDNGYVGKLEINLTGGTQDGIEVVGSDTPDINSIYTWDDTNNRYYNGNGWYIVNTNWYWNITNNLSNVWDGTAHYGAGGESQPVNGPGDVWYNDNGYSGDISTQLIAGGALEAITTNGKIYSSDTIKSSSNFSIKDKMVLSYDDTDKAGTIVVDPDGSTGPDVLKIKMISGTSTTDLLDFRISGAINAPYCNIADINENKDLITKEYADTNYGAPTGDANTLVRIDGNGGWLNTSITSDDESLTFHSPGATYATVITPGGAYIGDMVMVNDRLYLNGSGSSQYIRYVSGEILAVGQSNTPTQDGAIIVKKNWAPKYTDTTVPAVDSNGGWKDTKLSSWWNDTTKTTFIEPLTPGTSGVSYNIQIGSGQTDRTKNIYLSCENIVSAPDQTTTKLDAESSTSKALITKEYANANYGGSSIGANKINVSNGSGGWSDTPFVHSIVGNSHYLTNNDSTNAGFGLEGSFITMKTHNGSAFTVVDGNYSQETFRIEMSTGAGVGILPKSTISDIDYYGAKAIITKEYADANYSGGSNIKRRWFKWGIGCNGQYLNDGAITYLPSSECTSGGLSYSDLIGNELYSGQQSYVNTTGGEQYYRLIGFTYLMYQTGATLDFPITIVFYTNNQPNLATVTIGSGSYVNRNGYVPLATDVYLSQADFIMCKIYADGGSGSWDGMGITLEAEHYIS